MRTNPQAVPQGNRAQEQIEDIGLHQWPKSVKVKVSSHYKDPATPTMIFCKHWRLWRVTELMKLLWMHFHDSLYTTLKAEMQNQKAENAALQENINKALILANNDTETTNILKPKGMAGMNYSIQIKMDLSGSKKKNNKYKGILVCGNLTLPNYC